MRVAHIIFLLAFLALPGLKAEPTKGEPPVVLHYEGVDGNGKPEVVFEAVEATTPEQLQAAKRFMKKSAAENGGQAIVYAVEGDPEPGDPAANMGPSAEILAREVFSEVKATVVATNTKALGLKELRQKKSHRIWNHVFTACRVLGNGAGLTTIFSITYGVPFYQALPIGLAGATLSGILMKINKRYKSWLVTSGILSAPEPVEGALTETASHFNTIAKVGAVTLTYIGVLKLVAFGLGLPGDLSFFSAQNLQTFASSVALGTAVEYTVKRYLAESRKNAIEADFENRHYYETTTDAKTAGFSVILTWAQALISAGWTVGYISIGVIELSTGTLYTWKCAKPETFLGKVRARIARVAGCAWNLITGS